MKTIYALLLIFTISSCELKEDKGDTEKFIGTWKVESDIIDGKQVISDVQWTSGIVKIKDDYTLYSDSGIFGSGTNKTEIYFPTEETWTSYSGYVMPETGLIRMEKNSSVKLNIWGNKFINEIYELQGNTLIIKGAEYGGTLHHMILTRYSY